MKILVLNCGSSSIKYKLFGNKIIKGKIGRIEKKNYKKAIKSILNKLPKDIQAVGHRVLHEENLTIAHKYNIPSKFIYAVNIKTMDILDKIYKKKKNILKKNLILGDNTNRILEGSDSIGVLLKYPNKKVYYFNTIPNIAVIGTSATYTQVAIGIFAALLTLIFDKVKPGIHFVEDLYHANFKNYMFENMRVQEFVFKKNKLSSYNPEIKIKESNKFKRVYI